MFRKVSTLLLGFLGLAAAVDAAVEAGKTYRLVSVEEPGKSLFVQNASLDNGAQVVAWDETNVPAQQWECVEMTNGGLALKNVYTGLYLYKVGRQFRQATARPQQTVETILGDAWQAVETAGEPQFTTASRQRMIDGFLDRYMIRPTSGYVTFMYGGWGEAETLEAVLDMYEATGEQRYLTIFEQGYNFMKYHVGSVWTGGTAVGGYNWFGYDFNDDVMWMIIAAARAFHLSGKRVYLNDAKRNFDLVWQRANLRYIDMLRWAESSGDRNGTNSCINGPAEVAACYIAEGLGDESYYQKAATLYANQRKYLFNAETGQVYDSVVLNPENATVVSRNGWVSTYNQGTMLGAAVLLYRHFGDRQYKDDADKIIACAKRELCNGNGIIHVCQNVDGDFQGFKGILMRYAGLYAREFQNTEYANWLVANAFHAYNNMNSQSFGHSAWLTKAAEDMMFGTVDYGRSDSAFGASTAVSAACAVALPDPVATAVPAVHRTDAAAVAWYTLDGRQLASPASPGVYIHQSRKVIVR